MLQTTMRKPKGDRMGCCKRPPKMPSKTGVSRAEIAAHAFECSVGSKGDGFGAIHGRARNPTRVKRIAFRDGLSSAPHFFSTTRMVGASVKVFPVTTLRLWAMTILPV